MGLGRAGQRTRPHHVVTMVRVLQLWGDPQEGLCNVRGWSPNGGPRTRLGRWRCLHVPGGMCLHSAGRELSMPSVPGWTAPLQRAQQAQRELHRARVTCQRHTRSAEQAVVVCLARRRTGWPT